MKEPFSDEILSAYLDGELPPQERAAVERWLESNSAARAKLEDFRRLSGLFDSLPRTELPREFPTKVLQLSERRMLLPESGTVTARHRRNMRLLTIAASIGSVAALLFVAVHLLGPGLEPQQVAGPNEFAPGPLARGREKLIGDLGAQRRGADSVDQLIAQDDTSNVAEGKAGLSAPATFADQPPASDGLPEPSDGAKADLQLAAINESLGQLSNSGPAEKLTSVVRLHVVDQAGGLELLQNLLSENNVVLSEETDDGLETLPGRKQKRQRAAGKKEALYVVARPEQVMAAFTAVIERDSRAVLTVEEPIQIASFDPGSQKQLEELLRGLNRASLTADGPAPASASDRVPEASKAKAPAEKSVAPDQGDKGPPKPDSRSAPPTPAPAAGAGNLTVKKTFSMRKEQNSAPQPLVKDSDKAEPTIGAAGQDAPTAPRDGKQLATPGRQLVVPVPRELEEREMRSAARAIPHQLRSASSAVQADSAKGRVAPAREDKGKKEGEQAARGPALVRVLIVIDPGDPRPAAPAAAKSPDGGAS